MTTFSLDQSQWERLVEAFQIIHASLDTLVERTARPKAPCPRCGLRGCPGPDFPHVELGVGGRLGPAMPLSPGLEPPRTAKPGPKPVRHQLHGDLPVARAMKDQPSSLSGLPLSSFYTDATGRRVAEVYGTIPGLEPPRPDGCPSCAEAEAQVDRMAQRVNELEHETADLVMVAHQQGYGLAQGRIRELEAALDLEAKARGAMAEGLAQAKVERDKLVADARTMAAALAVCERWLQCRCSRPAGMDYRDECPRCSKESPRVDLLRGMAAAAPYLPDDSPAIRADDLVEALDDDPEPHRGWDEGHDTPEERDGER